MKVYLAHNGQSSGEDAVCATLEGAKRWLLDSLSKTASDDGVGDQWDGWAWWVDEDGRHCFGADPITQPPHWGLPVPEGTIAEHELLS